jgi:hypothetical protein
MVRLAAECWGFFWFQKPGRSRTVGDAAMANERTFAELAYERRRLRLTEHGTLRRRAVALVVMGALFLLTGVANRDPFAVTVGSIALAAGGVWRWCLAA